MIILPIPNILDPMLNIKKGKEPAIIWIGINTLFIVVGIQVENARLQMVSTPRNKFIPY